MLEHRSTEDPTDFRRRGIGQIELGQFVHSHACRDGRGRYVDAFGSLAVADNLCSDETAAFTIRDQLDPDLARGWVICRPVERLNAGRNDRHAFGGRLIRTQAGTRDRKIKDFEYGRADRTQKLASPRRQVLAGDTSLLGSNRSDVVEYRPLSDSTVGFRTISGRKYAGHVRFHVRIDRYCTSYAGLNAGFARKVHIWYNSSVKQYHICRLDTQTACRFDPGNPPIAAN